MRGLDRLPEAPAPLGAVVVHDTAAWDAPPGHLAVVAELLRQASRVTAALAAASRGGVAVLVPPAPVVRVAPARPAVEVDRIAAAVVPLALLVVDASQPTRIAQDPAGVLVRRADVDVPRVRFRFASVLAPGPEHEPHDRQQREQEAPRQA